LNPTLKFNITQEKVVVAFAILIFILFSFFLNGFFTTGNLINVVRNVSVLGVLGVGMAIVIIGRGIDLSMVSVLAISAAFFIELLNAGMPIWSSFIIVMGAVVLVGAMNGYLVAYAEIPPIFATLAMGLFVYGFGRSQLMDADAAYIADEYIPIFDLGTMRLAGIPIEVFVFAGVCLIAMLFLRFTKDGGCTYFMGDNFMAGRNIGEYPHCQFNTAVRRYLDRGARWHWVERWKGQHTQCRIWCTLYWGIG